MVRDITSPGLRRRQALAPMCLSTVGPVLLVAALFIDRRHSMPVTVAIVVLGIGWAVLVVATVFSRRDDPVGQRIALTRQGVMADGRPDPSPPALGAASLPTRRQWRLAAAITAVAVAGVTVYAVAFDRHRRATHGCRPVTTAMAAAAAALPNGEARLSEFRAYRSVSYLLVEANSSLQVGTMTLPGGFRWFISPATRTPQLTSISPLVTSVNPSPAIQGPVLKAFADASRHIGTCNPQPLR